MKDNKRYLAESFVILDALILIFIAFFAFIFCFKCGQRGFFAFDQSNYFDGAFRVFSGQVPYKDFYSPFAFSLFYFQALFFRIFGVNYYAYLISAAFVNALAAICSVFVIRRLFPTQKITSYVAGIITAIWFYPPFGTLCSDKMAFFIALVSLICVLQAIIPKESQQISWRSNIYFILCGAFLFFCFLEKQNVGMLVSGLPFFLIAGKYLPDVKRVLRGWGLVFIGLVGAFLLMLLWLWLFSDIRQFFNLAFYIPSQTGSSMFSSLGSNILPCLFFPVEYWRLSMKGIAWLPMVKIIIKKGSCLSAHIGTFLAISFSFVLGGINILKLKNDKSNSRQFLLAACICLYYSFVQNAFITLSFNQKQTGMSLTGIILALFMGLLYSFYAERIRALKGISKVACNLILVCMLFFSGIFLIFPSIREGIAVSWKRTIVHEIGRSDQFKPVTISEMKPLLWLEPTRAGRFGAGVKTIKEDDVKRLYDYLKMKNRPFFIFPDFTIFYGLLNRPSQQPVLWFQEGRTYPKNKYDNDLDVKIINALNESDIRIIILERVSFFGTESRLENFPELKKYIKWNFDRAFDIGIFRVLEKNIVEE